MEATRTPTHHEKAKLRQEVEELRARNRELVETIDAIRRGEVDAIVVAEEGRHHVYSLEGVDYPYRVLVERIQEGALTLSPEGMILYANAAFARLRRCPLSAILGTWFRDHVAPRDQARFDALLAASLVAPCRGELSICTERGSIPVQVSMTPTEAAGDTRVSVIVTDRRQDFGRLRLLARMLDSVVEAVSAADPDGRIIYWNKAAERLYGWTAAEMIGRPLSDAIGPGLSAEEYRRLIEEPMAGRTWSGEYTACDRDGRCFSVQATRAPVYDEDGFLIAIIGTSHDITGRKQAEEELRRYAGELQASNSELQRFAYVASHDLQEPLRSIVSFSQLLERRYRGRLDSDADDYIEFIVDGGIRMQTLIQDLLSYSRIEIGAKPMAPTDAGTVVADALRSMDTALREAGATVEVGPLPAVMADAAQLEQVFSNLVGNAIKYRRPGVPPVIAITARRLDGMVEFSVSDNGIGIEPEYYDRIFEMFRRLHTHDKYEGTGIGLAVVKRIAERHGGTILVESTPGEGSTFFFTIPAA